MIDLLDVNVLVALAWPNHVHHRAALAWFGARAGQPWATTPITQTGFVRVSSNPAAVPTVVSPTEATVMLQRICQVAGHNFVADDLDLCAVGPLARLVTHREVTDAHLLGLARRLGGRLATFDRGLSRLCEQPGDVSLIPF